MTDTNPTPEPQLPALPEGVLQWLAATGAAAGEAPEVSLLRFNAAVRAAMDASGDSVQLAAPLEPLEEPPGWTLARFNAGTEAAFAPVCDQCTGTVRSLETRPGRFAWWMQHDRACPDFTE